MPRNPLVTLAALGLTLVAGCGGGSDAGSGADAPAGSATAAAAVDEISRPMDLSEGDVESYLAVLEELSALGEEYGDRDGNLTDLGPAIVANAKAQAILSKHGYRDLLRFQRVAWNIGAAMAASEMSEEDVAEMQNARQQLESMKSQMPKEQFDMMVKAQEQMAELVANVPPGNKELVGRFADRIRAAVEN